MPAIRPASLDAFHGQKAATDHLRVSCKAALRLKRPHGHTLFLGPPGLGKTTLGATVLPAEMGTTAKVINCSSIEKPQDLLPTLSTMGEGEILFLDEIHALIRPLMENLYGVMEDAKLSIVMGEGDTRQTMVIDLNRYTVVGATTREGLLPAPLRDRFRHVLRLDLYSDSEMFEVLSWVGNTQGIEEATPSAINMLVPACHGTARHAVSLIEACIETIASDDQLAKTLILPNGQMSLTKPVVRQTLKRLRIAPSGLTYPEQRLLGCLADSSKGVVGLHTLASVIDEEVQTIEEVYEPWLLRTGMIEKTPQGRTITPKGRQALKDLSGG